MGINTMMAGPEVGLAVPVYVVKAFLDKVLDSQRRGNETRALFADSRVHTWSRHWIEQPITDPLAYHANFHARDLDNLVK